MPGYKGHLAGAAVTYAIGLYFLMGFEPSGITMAEWFMCTCAGALFPDVDIKSKGQKLLYRILLILFGFLLLTERYQLLSFVSILAIVPMIVRHRGLFHNIWFVVFFPVTVASIIGFLFPGYQTLLYYDILFFVAGAISHLWLDLGFKRMLRIKT